MRAWALAAVAASVVLLAGCSAGPAEPAGTSIPPSALPTSPTPTVAPTEGAEPDTAAPTCETLIDAATVAAFQDVGWTSKAEPFMIGAAEVPGGLLCKWGDASGSGEGLQIFGWAPITESKAEAAKAELLESGWRSVDTDEGDFVTESSDTAFATGEQGYGLTYQFGDGFVIFADTKQSLLLIEPPQV